jgi:hypothetical protein
MQRSTQKELEFFDLVQSTEKPWHFLLRVAPFDTGFIVTERIPLFVFADDIADTVYIEPFSFYVNSSLTYADSLLIDIAPPRAFRLKFIDYFVPILVLILIATSIYLFKKFWKKSEKVVEVVDTRPAWLLALELLDVFKKKRFLENGQYLDFYFDLSLIFRFFIEKQHDVNAMEMTTSEIKQALSEIPRKREIIAILSDMDKIKFAKFVPSVKEAEDILYWIENYIVSFSKSGEENV